MTEYGTHDLNETGKWPFKVFRLVFNYERFTKETLPNTIKKFEAARKTIVGEENG